MSVADRVRACSMLGGTRSHVYVCYYSFYWGGLTMPSVRRVSGTDGGPDRPLAVAATSGQPRTGRSPWSPRRARRSPGRPATNACVTGRYPKANAALCTRCAPTAASASPCLHAAREHERAWLARRPLDKVREPAHRATGSGQRNHIRRNWPWTDDDLAVTLDESLSLENTALLRGCWPTELTSLQGVWFSYCPATSRG